MAIYKEPLGYIEDSINSTVKSLESFDYEFIIVVDNPNLSPVIEDFLKKLDGNFIIHHNENNIGLANSLNVAIDMISGDYVMRMDADDICHPDRVKKQLSYLNENDDLCLIGSDIIKIDNSGNRVGVGISVKGKYNSIDLKCPILYRTLCFHPTWFAKSEVFRKYKYNDLKTSQDLDFQFRLLQSGESIGNIPEKLLYYRISNESLSLKKGWEQTIIRYSLNSLFKSGEIINFVNLTNNINMFKSKKYLKKVFEKMHVKFIDALINRHILTLIFCCLFSPMHFYKMILIIKSKLLGK